MVGLKKQIESIVRKRADELDASKLDSFKSHYYIGEPTEYTFSEKEAFEVAKDELTKDLENHDLEWATDIYYPLKNEERLKKEIIYFINKLTY